MTQDVGDERIDQVLSGLSRTLLDNMAEGVTLARDDGVIVFANRAEEEMFGYSVGELVGVHFGILNGYDPASRNRFR